MGQKMQFRRGNEANLPTLDNGEPALVHDKGDLYIGTPTGNQLIGGKSVTEQLAEIAYSVKGKTTQEIQSIIDDFHLQGQIYFPKTETNVYTITDTLLIPSNTDILIAEGVTLRLADGVDKPIIENADKVNGNEKIKIIGGIFDINPVNQTVQVSCLKFTNVNYSHFENIEVTATKFTGYITDGAFQLTDCNYNIIKECSVHDAGSEGLVVLGSYNKVIGGRYYDNPNGSGVSTGGQHSRNEIIGVTCENNKGSNIAINTPNTIVSGCYSLNGAGNNGITMGHQGSPADYGVVTDCIVENCNDGIRVLGSSKYVTVANNKIIKANKRDGTKTAVGIGVSDGAIDCIVTGNTIRECDAGIVVNTDGNVIVTDNMIDLSVGHGINIIKAIYSVFHKNIVKNGGAHGINIGSGGTFNNVSYNQCYDNQATPTQTRGIYDGGSNNDFAYNTLLNHTTSDYTPGTGSTSLKNKLSTTDLLVLQVDLVDGTSQTINNGNVRSFSQISIVPKTSGASARNLYISAITTGSFTISMDAGALGDSVTVFIS